MIRPLLVSCSLLAAACAVEDPDLSSLEAAIDDDPGEGGEDFPEELPPQPPTTSFRLTDKSASSVELRWAAPSNTTATYVQRRVTGGTWMNVRTYGATSGVIEYENTGLTQDTRYCYRIAVANDAGTRATSEKCALTETPNSPSLHRVRIELRVADVSGAGTDDDVGVSLNDTYWGNFTGLDYEHDDLERNSTFRYDLTFENLAVLHDIANITVHKYGSDSLCLRSLRLLLDEVPAFTREFGNTATTCQPVNGKLAITHAQLRAATSFSSWEPPFPSLVIDQEEIEERLEGIMGDLIWGNPDVAWGHIYDGEAVSVEASPYDDDSIRVDFDLEGIKNNWPNPDVDIDLTLRVGFVGSGANLRLSIESTWFQVNVDHPLWLQIILSLGTPVCGPATGEHCVQLLETHIEDKIEAGFAGFSESFAIGEIPCDSPTVTVTDQADLVFGCE